MRRSHGTRVLPNRPTARSELESTHATLLAKLLAAHAAHDELLRKVEGLRGSLLHGAISQEMDLRGGEDLAELPQHPSLARDFPGICAG